MKLIRGRTRWSDIEIDADKDMQRKSLTNLYNIEFNNEIRKNSSSYRIQILDSNARLFVPLGGYYSFAGDGRINPFSVPQPSFGFSKARWKDGWFAGNLGLGVIKNIGDTLTVDVIYDNSYLEKASDLTERIYSYDSNFPISDWKVENINTFTENGIITGIKLQLDGYSTYDVLTYYELYEDGTQIGSIVISTHSYSTRSIEVNTLKSNATYEGKINPYGYPSDGECGIRNRYLYFRKRYIGIKAGK